tara:strand:- start:148 stop:372 length:225 start_codon:yes stop_codon:yes gene_type:complete
MNNLKLQKQYIGFALISIGSLGGICALLVMFGFDLNDNAYLIFTTFQGGASNTPFLFGILAFSGALLLASIKDD